MAFELQAYPEASFADRLQYLDILRQLNDAGYTKYLTQVEEDAAKKPADLAALLSWMNRNGMGLIAVDFSRSLPADRLQEWPVPMALAGSYTNVKDWPSLEKLTAIGSWNNFEFLRHAYLARACREQDKLVKAEGEWAAARKFGESEAQHLMLAETVSEWGWNKETDELLWELTKRSESEAQALQTLYERYTRMGDAGGLYKVLSRLLEIRPKDLTVKNNFAQIALLLKVDVKQAQKIAADLHRQEPTNAGFTSTYAFALYRDGKADQAAQLMATLSSGQLKDPALSFYYGVFLAAAGDSEKAKGFLQAGANSPMFPEERDLFAEAKRRAQMQ